MSLKKYGDRSDRAADITRRRVVEQQVLRDALKDGWLEAPRQPVKRPYKDNPDAFLEIEPPASRAPLKPNDFDLRKLLSAAARRKGDRQLRESAQLMLDTLNAHSHDKPISKQMWKQFVEAERYLCDYFGAQSAKTELNAIGNLMTADAQRVMQEGYARRLTGDQTLKDALKQRDREVASLAKEVASLSAERADLTQAQANWAAERANLTEALADSNAHCADLTEALADSNAHRAALEDRLREVNALLAFREAELEEMRQQIDDLRQQLQKKCTVPELAMIMVGVMADDIGRALAAAGQKYMERFPLSEEQADAYQVVLNQEYEQSMIARASFLRLLAWLRSVLAERWPSRTT